jgi:hypothetical protein
MKINIVIRFSIRFSNFKSMDDKLRTNWFEYRSELFYLTTYRSILRNNHSNIVIYLILNHGDENLYEKYLSKLDIIPLFSDEKDYKNLINQKIVDHKKTLFLRLDSDDLISNNYINTVLNKIKDTSRDDKINQYFITPSGYFSDLINYQKYYDLVPSFILFYKKTKSNENIFDYDHNDINKLNPVIIQNAKWIQLIHKRNVANKLDNNNEVILLLIKNFIKFLLIPFNSRYKIVQFKSFKNSFHYERFVDFLDLDDWKKLIYFLERVKNNEKNKSIQS